VAADLQYAQGIARLSSGDYQAAANYFSKALTLHSEHVYEDRMSSALANMPLFGAYDINNSDATRKLTNLSRDYINHAITRSPRNMLYWKTKGKNEYAFYQANPDESYIAEAISALNHAYELAPTEPKLPYTLGLLYGASNKKDISMRYLDKTISLKPDYQDAYFLKLKLLKAWKETGRADELESEILRTFPGMTRDLIEKEIN
jgi:tetratricopeptide (TPR) repeat protein